MTDLVSFHNLLDFLYVSLYNNGDVMDAISYTAARANLAQTMDQVCNDHSPVIITRKKGAPVVLISLEDYQALEETTYLLSSSANARRLLESIAELETGKGVTR